MRRAAGIFVMGVAWALSFFVFMILRFEGWSGFEAPGATNNLLLAFVIAFGVSTGFTIALERRLGRPLAGSFEDAWRLVTCNFAGGMAMVVVNLGAQPRLVPISVSLSATLGAIAIVLASRAFLRWHRWTYRQRNAEAMKAIIFGAGDGSCRMIDAILSDRSSGYLPVAILDDDRSKLNMSVRGIRVAGGRNGIRKTAEETQATVMIIAIPSADSKTVRQLSKLALEGGLEVRVLPTVTDFLDGKASFRDVRFPSVEDLLGRDAVEIDLALSEQLVKGRRVLITGAGGSIGSEIARQVFALGPAELTLLDRDESSLHALQLQLEGRALLDSRNLVVADIRDRDRIGKVFAEHRPEIVFHAAALKHLPLLELHPTEGVKSNVMGTKNVLDAAGAVGVDCFVNISTDKAANPTSVLGASKRLAEGLTASASHTYAGKFMSVRFGNVLGSRGTVIDSFRAQIVAGGPITITDPAVTRFFMTVSEAVRLVLHAAVIGLDSEVMVLDMGEPVRIVDVANLMAADYSEPIEIVYTGLRLGEKLHEDLFGDGEVGVRSEHPKIFHVQVPAVDGSALDELVSIDGDLVAYTMLAMIRRLMVVEVVALEAPQGSGRLTLETS